MMLTLLDWANWLLTIFGLVIIAFGALVTARAVIIDDQTAGELAGMYWGGNNALKTALLQQSSAAKRGLYMIVGGSLLQIAAVVAQAVRAMLS